MNLHGKHYFDCNATSPLHEDVLRQLPEWAAEWGNPSSIHWASRGPKLLIRESRQKMAQGLGVNSLEFIFTSGGSESNNTVIKTHLALALKTGTKKHFITSMVEHPSVFKTMQAIHAQGVDVDFIPVSRSGFLDLDFYQSVLSEQTALVSVMLANNETGSIFPIQKLAQWAHDKQAFFHTDAVQALGKISVNLKNLDVDYASFSAHKFYALKGLGLLYARKGAPLENLIIGGAQERHRRGGTENTLGISALGCMAEKLSLVTDKMRTTESLRDLMEQLIREQIPDVLFTAQQGPRLGNTSSLVIKDVDGETLLMSLDLKGYAVSTGAACSSGNPEPSPVLLAMGLSREEAQSSLRISLGWFHTETDIRNFVDELKTVVERLRSLKNTEVKNYGF